MILHPDHPTLRSSRLILILSTPDILDKVLESDAALSGYLDIAVPDHWSEFGDAPFRYMKTQVEQDPLSVEWWSWLPVLKDGNTLAGNCGYKGSPKDGVVEIGYEVAREFRNRGLATEIASTLIENAFRHDAVHAIRAHTLPAENESVRVLRKCGFQFDAAIEDPDDGTIWRWTLVRSGWPAI